MSKFIRNTELNRSSSFICSSKKFLMDLRRRITYKCKIFINLNKSNCIFIKISCNFLKLYVPGLISPAWVTCAACYAFRCCPEDNSSPRTSRRGSSQLWSSLYPMTQPGRAEWTNGGYWTQGQPITG